MLGGGRKDIYKDDHELPQGVFVAVWKEAYHQKLKQCVGFVDVDIRASSKVCGLLKKDAIWSMQFAYINCHFLRERE